MLYIMQRNIRHPRKENTLRSIRFNIFPCLLLIVPLVQLSCSSQKITSPEAAICGDGVVGGDEVCDDGFKDACGSCNADCTATGDGASCGDGVVCEELEVCDDEFTDACGSCNADCTAAGLGASCGDGVVCEEFETCDDGADINSDDWSVAAHCNSSCSDYGLSCGDGIVSTANEICELGDTTPCGPCALDCGSIIPESVCGDGLLCAATETCDDGYTDWCGSCNSDCTGSGVAPVCGDFELCVEIEACDDGNTEGSDFCSADCLTQTTEVAVAVPVHSPLTGGIRPFGFYSGRWVKSLDKLVGVGVFDGGSGVYSFESSSEELEVFPNRKVYPIRYSASAEVAVYRSGNILRSVDFVNSSDHSISVPNRKASYFWLSPDASQVLFITTDNNSTGEGLALANIDGSGAVELLVPSSAQRLIYENYGFDPKRPRITPDGTRVIYSLRPTGSSQSELYSVKSDGTDIKKLNGTLVTDGTVGIDQSYTMDFLISKDSSRVVYIASEDTAGVPEIYSVKPDGSDHLKLSGTLVSGGSIVSSWDAASMQFTPDGQRLVFIADRETDGLFELYSVNFRDGTNLIKHSAGESVSANPWPAFSPDGSTIIFTSEDSVVYATPLAGAGLTPLSPGGGAYIDTGSYGPRFSPDGQSVIYISDQDGFDQDLYISSIDGLSNIKLSQFEHDQGEVEIGDENDPGLLFVPGAAQLIFRADLEKPYKRALFLANFDGTGLIEITPEPLHSEETESYLFGIEDGFVYFAYDDKMPQVSELYSYEIATGALTNLSENWPEFIIQDAQRPAQWGGLPGAEKQSFYISGIASYKIDGVMMVDYGTTTSCLASLPTPTSDYLASSGAMILPSGEYLYSKIIRATSVDYVAISNDSCAITPLSFTPAISNIKIGSTADSTTLLFSGAQTTTEKQLFAADADGSNLRTLSIDLFSGGAGVGSWMASPDSAHVAYYAEGAAAGQWELRVVKLAGSSTVTLSTEATAIAGFTPDSATVVFYGDSDGDGVRNLYAVDIDGTNLQTLTTGVGGTGVATMIPDGISPDSQRVVYTAKYGSATGATLYSAAVDGSGEIQIGQDYGSDARMGRSLISSNSASVVFLQRPNLYSAPIDGSAMPTLINEGLSGGPVYFSLSADDATVIYTANGSPAFTREIFANSVSGGTEIQLLDLNGLQGVRQSSVLDGPMITPAGNLIVLSDVFDEGRWGIYRIPIAGGSPVEIVPPYASRRIQDYGLSPDGTWLAVFADFRQHGVTEVFRFDLN